MTQIKAAGISNREFRPMYGWALIAVLFCAFVAFFLSFQAGFFALIFVLTAWYVWKYPEEGFLLLLVLLPILPMFKITQTIGTFSLVKDVIIITLFAKTFALPLLQKTLPYRRNILFAPIFALVLWAIIAMLQADSIILGILRLRDIVLYLLAYFAVLYLPKHDVHTQIRRMWIFGIATGITLLLATWQWFLAVDSAVLRFDPVRKIWIPRLSSVLAHPSIYGEYLIAAGALVLGIAATATSRAVQIRAGVAALILLPFILLTYSRAVWLGLVAAIGAIIAAYAWYVIKTKLSIKKLTAYATVGLIVAVLGLAVVAKTTPVGGLLRSIVDPTYGSNEERVEFLVRLIAPLTPVRAIVGNGLGDVITQNFRVVDLQAYDIAAGAARNVQLTKNQTLVDNQHLKTFIEMGVIGLGIYLWLYGRVAWAAFRTAVDTVGNSYQRTIGFFAIGFLAAFVLQGFFIDIWDIFPTNLLFWIIAALLSQQKEKPSIPVSASVATT